MPSMFSEPDLDAFQRLRCAFDPHGLANPGQGDAHAAAVRRGPGALPRAPAGASGHRRAILMAHRSTRRAPETFAQAAAEALAAASADGRSVRFAGAAPSSAGAAPRSRPRSSSPRRHWTGSSSTTRAITPRSSRPACRWPRAQRAVRRRPGSCWPSTRRWASRTYGHDRRHPGHRRFAVRCATASAPPATWCSASPSRSATAAIARSGSKVIKNVAGYDLAKLFAGAFGTLGLILSVSVRLHPLPHGQHDRARRHRRPRPAGRGGRGAGGRAARVRSARRGLARGPRRTSGPLRRAVSTPAARRRAARLLDELGLVGVDMHRRRRGPVGAPARRAALRGRAPSVRIAAPPRRPGRRCSAPTRPREGTLVGRAALGTSYVELAPQRVAELRARSSPRRERRCSMPPRTLRAQHDPWGAPQAPALSLMRSVKDRFDPTGTCNPGLFVGGI